MYIIYLGACHKGYEYWWYLDAHSHLPLHRTDRWLRAGLALAKTCPREQSLPNSARRE